MKKIISLALLLAIITFAACSSDDKDTTEPTVEIISPDNDARFKIGSTINLIVEFADNEMLGSYKIDIHDASDGHTHNHTSTKSVSTRHGDHDHGDGDHDHEHVHFAYKKIGELPGTKNARLEFEIHIPEFINDISIEGGEYHLVVFVVDKAGNDNLAYRTIHLEW